MHARLLTLIGLLSLAIAIASLAARAQTPAASQRTSASPRTPWGDPDLQGVWDYATMTPLERPRELEKEVLTDEEAAAYERQFLERQKVGFNTAGPDWWDKVHLAGKRSSLIVDPPNGRIPPLTPEAQKRAAAAAQARRGRGPADSVEDLGLGVRCLQFPTAGPPMLPAMYNNNVHIVKTRQYVALVNEMIHDVRIVPMDGRPHGRIRQWLGDSRGHWDGTTLVVDTVNFTDNTSFRGSNVNLHLVERFTRVNENRLEYTVTVDDPTTWTRPWTFMVPWTRQSDKANQVYESTCHEGNYGMVGMLTNTRAAERLYRQGKGRDPRMTDIATGGDTGGGIERESNR